MTIDNGLAAAQSRVALEQGHLHQVPGAEPEAPALPRELEQAEYLGRRVEPAELHARVPAPFEQVAEALEPGAGDGHVAPPEVLDGQLGLARELVGRGHPEAQCEIFSPVNSMAEALGQAATQVSQPMQAAASKAASAFSFWTGTEWASGAPPVLTEM